MMRRLCLRARSVFAVAVLVASAVHITACAARSTSATTSAAASASRSAPVFVAGYVAYVASEASDIVTRIRFIPGSPAEVERTTGVGTPGRIVGPHGVAISADGRYWFVSLSHGVPTGRVARYSTGADSLNRGINVGAFPETIAQDADYIYVTNSDANGSNTVSSVSVLFAATMTEVARPSTCVRPQGGRIALDAHHYSVCEGSDQLVAIDTRTLQVSQRFSLAPGQERILDNNMRGGGRRGARGCAPTWVEPGRGARLGSVYVACSRSNEILEIDARAWTVTRRIAAPVSPYRLAADSAGRTLYATLAADSAVIAIDLASGSVRARITTSQASPHSIVITRDNRYAFVSNEGSGSARGTVDVIDLATFERVSSVTVGYGAGALDVMQLRMVRR